MSSLYELEPPTNGKVLLKTTVGDIEIALWSKETPKACRNFLQHCANNYYNGTVFHHIQKDFIIQGGDPTGTGHGGYSVYGEPFKDEFHQRLRFTRRGLVAMANCGRPNTNLSQFFITLGPCNDLNNKNTIFGHIVGNTMYNVLKMLDIDVDFSNRPVDPPKIIKSAILEQPFSDVVPTIHVNKCEDDVKAKKESIFKHVKASKNRQLLSFGDDNEFEDDVELNLLKKPKSIHDVIKDDPTLSNKTLQENEPMSTQEKQLIESRKRKVDEPNQNSDKVINDAKDDEEGATKKERTQKKLEKIKEEQRQLKKEMKKNMLSVIKKKKQVEKLKDEMKNNEAGGRENDDDSLYGYDVDSYGSFDVGSVDDYLKVNLKYMVKSQRFKLVTKKARSNREDIAMSLLKGFSDKIRESATMGDRSDFENGPNAVPSTESWLNHKLEFEKDYSVSNAIDTHVVSIDNYDISDPRNKLNQHNAPTNKNK